MICNLFNCNLISSLLKAWPLYLSQREHFLLVSNISFSLENPTRWFSISFFVTKPSENELFWKKVQSSQLCHIVLGLVLKSPFWSKSIESFTKRFFLFYRLTLVPLYCRSIRTGISVTHWPWHRWPQPVQNCLKWWTKPFDYKVTPNTRKLSLYRAAVVVAKVMRQWNFCGIWTKSPMPSSICQRPSLFWGHWGQPKPPLTGNPPELDTLLRLKFQKENSTVPKSTVTS